jgi:hypothetical protein
MALNFDYEGAKQAGATDADIAKELSSTASFDYIAAKQAGATDADIIKELLSSSQAPKQQPAQELSMIDQMFGMGSPAQRVAKAAAFDPLIGVAQMVVDPVANILGKGQPVKEYAREVAARTQAGRQARDSEGFDWFNLLGAVTSPTNLLYPIKGATALGTVKSSAQAGAALGAMQPVLSEGSVGDVASEKLQQGLLGAGIGAAVGGGAELGKTLFSHARDIMKPLTATGRTEMLQQYVKGMLPEFQRGNVASALSASPELVKGSRPSVASALADVPAATNLAAFSEKVAKTAEVAPFTAMKQAEREAARARVFTEMGGTEESIAQSIAAREVATRKLREDALTAADEAGRLAPEFQQAIAQKYKEKVTALQMQGKLSTEAQQQSALSKEWTPVPGMPRAPAQYSLNADQILGNLQGAREAGDMAALKQAQMQFKQYQLDSLAANGYYPLETAPIISKIQSVIRGQAGNDLVEQGLTQTIAKLERFTDQNGVIPSHILYNIRKDIAQDLQAVAGQSQRTWDAKVLDKVYGNVKNYFDNAIESAGGESWKDYLKTYAAMSKEVNQKQIAQYLGDALQSSLANTERAVAFKNAVDNSALTIKRATGQPRKDLGDIQTPEQKKQTLTVLADIEREARGKLRASKSAQGIDVVGTGENIQMLDNKVTIAKSLLRNLASGSNEKIYRQFASMTNQELADFISAVPVSKADGFVKGLWKALPPQGRELLTRRLAITAPMEVTEQAQIPNITITGTE